MLASNALVATFALFLLFSFTEISQGKENQPKNVIEDTLKLFSGHKIRNKRAGLTQENPKCPPITPGTVGICVEACSGDNDCPAGEICCFNGCGHTCERVARTSLAKRPIDQGNVECGKRKAGSRIVGGIDAQPGSWPWQVLLVYKGFDAPVWCGGSILTPYWIVTAAHCFDLGQNPTAYIVTVGEHDLRKAEGTEQTIPIDKITLHPKYRPERTALDYDVALIKLKKPIKFKSNVRPVCLPKENFAPGTNCYVTGWGDTTEGGNIAQILQQAKVPLVARYTCQRAYSNLGATITNRMRCAGFSQGGVDACQGDSGGPLVCPRNNKWYLTGIVSWGEGCARPKYFGVYSDVFVLKSWVEDTINKSPIG